jgi:hypothetical protein
MEWVVDLNDSNNQLAFIANGEKLLGHVEQPNFKSVNDCDS